MSDKSPLLSTSSTRNRRRHTNQAPSEDHGGGDQNASQEFKREDSVCVPLSTKTYQQNRTSVKLKSEEKPESDWTDLLPYKGKVFLARVKKNEDTIIMSIYVIGLICSLLLLYICYFHFDFFHFHVSRAYAHMGHAHAQHVVAERLLHGKGVEKDHNEAMVWYKMAAEQGHPHSSYNLAIGHLNGMKVGLEPGDAHHLIKHAAENGVVEAKDVFENACKMGMCED